MQAPSKKHQEKLASFKENVRIAHDYWRPNNERYNEMRRFVFQKSINEREIQMLEAMQKPTIEFCILPAYIDRQLGEFAKQEPSIMVSTDNEELTDAKVVRVVEQHLRHILCDSGNHHTAYEVFKDLLTGGFSCFKITTDYADSKSFHQVIKWDRVYDPTLCGFDPLARLSHKGDGDFCFENFPMKKDKFQELYPWVDIKNIQYAKKFEGFNWSYSTNKGEKFIIVCDYYTKKRKETMIYQLADGSTVTKNEYKKRVENLGPLDIAPEIITERKTSIETIDRYRMIENMVIEYAETDYTMFPIVFADGSSVILRGQDNQDVRQFTRPYVLHAVGAQRLKNMAGISLGHQIENMSQAKLMVAKSALPQEKLFMEAYISPQSANVYVFNDKDSNGQPIGNPISPFPQLPCPPEIMQTFQAMDGLTQQILGSYDAALGINDNQLSGKAIIAAASNSNAAAMPFVVGYLQGLQRVAEIIVDLIPKYYTTPRTIPIRDAEGRKAYIKINPKPGEVQNMQPGAQNPFMPQQGGMDMGANPLTAIMGAWTGQAGMLDMAEMGTGFPQQQSGNPGQLPSIHKQQESNTIPGYEELNGISLDYDDNVLNVKVEAGVNFQVQKSQALTQIVALMQSSPTFGEFINTKGLSCLLDNLDIRGIDSMKEMVKEWQRQKEQEQMLEMQLKQKDMQNNPQQMLMQIEMQKMQQQAQKMQLEYQGALEKVSSEQQIALMRIENERIKMLADLEAKMEETQMKREQNEVQLLKISQEAQHNKEVHEAENFREMVKIVHDVTRAEIATSDRHENMEIMNNSDV